MSIKMLAVCPLLILLAAMPLITAQTASGLNATNRLQEKQITFRQDFPQNAPLRITQLTVNGTPAPLNQSLSITPSSLRNIAITVTNTSSKVLTYVSATLVLSQITSNKTGYAPRSESDPPLAFQIGAGQQSEFLLRRSDGTMASEPAVPSIAIQPGETVTMHVIGAEPSDSKRIYALLPALSEADVMLSII